MRNVAKGLILAGLLAAPSAAQAAAGKVSYLEGKAYRQPHGQGERVTLQKDAEVEQGDVLTTEAKSRLEVTLQDESVLRVGPKSEAVLEADEFKDEGRKVSTKVVLGSVWAKVQSAVGSDSKFEVTTERAVAGVRGTTFRVDAKQDKAVVVKVFAGAVAVAGNHIPTLEHATPKVDPKTGKPARTRVEGPKQVSKQEWEKLVGAQMQIAVNADGSPGEPQKFAQADECKDEWSRWNKERDGEPCPK